ncbi:hypothetical protein ACOTTU_16650 [Roseobacter sp. EG26]|uniref:hypothetical protein n=1 Tax=Roseobacter sp. EG26 TaxID=3412477 RepID=UPI003CE5BA52
MPGNLLDIKSVLAALDLDDVGHVADINARSVELVIALHQRYGSTIDVICLNDRGAFSHAPVDHLEEYLETLQKAGVVMTAVRIVQEPAALKQYDVLASLDGFGARSRIRNLKPVLDAALHPLSRVIVEIRKGSGSYPFLNTYGSCNTLLSPDADRNGLAILSVEPQQMERPAETWSRLAKGLAGPDGFYSDLGEHSFLYVPRGDTLVVTFDNLDIAMTKREERRPWGYDFIEANGWSMLGVMANGWTWFRDVEVIQKFLELRESGFFSDFARVVFYGASMGGYAAAAFAAAAPGATVFAISPQSTLDKSLVPWEMRYQKAWGRDFSGDFGDAALSSQSARDVHIMFDPYITADASHARRFTADNVTFWRCPLLGHRLGSSLSQMGILPRISTDAISGELTRPQFHRLLRKRHTFPRFQRELANLALDRGHPNLAKITCQYVLRQRDDPYFQKMLARIEAA